MSKYIYRALSFFWDIPIEKLSSGRNEYLELVWSQGKKVLNTKNANYSFGTDSEVFEAAFNEITSKINKTRNLLILGFACGGIIKVLEDKFNFIGKVKGIEFDDKIIDLYNRYFKSHVRSQLNIAIQDANTYVNQSQEKYDLILVDLFLDLKVAPCVYTPEFLNGAIKLLNPTGTIVINVIALNSEDQYLIGDLMVTLSLILKQVQKIDVNDLNSVVIGTK